MSVSWDASAWREALLLCYIGTQTFAFRMIGLNSITIYLAQRVVNFGHIFAFFLKGIDRNVMKQ